MTDLVADLYRHDGVRRLDLDGLETEDVVEYLVGAGVARGPARRSAVLLRDQTGGNAFFLHELWRELSVRRRRCARLRRLRRAEDGARQARPASRLALDRADGVLGLVAVLGQQVDLATLVEVCALDAADTLTAVDLFVAAGLLEGDAEANGYRFTHALGAAGRARPGAVGAPAAAARPRRRGARAA